MAELRTDEPLEITAGATVKFRKLAPDHPSPDWVLTYHFRPRVAGPAGFDVEADEGAGGSHVVTIPAATTAGKSGVYAWQAWAAKGDETFMIDSGEVTVKPGFAGTDESAAFDTRSQAVKDLEAVRAALAGNLTVARYQIGGRELERVSKRDLLALESSLVVRVNAEKRRAAMRRGGSGLKSYKLRSK